MDTRGLQADRASISSDGRDYMAAVDELTERARQDEPGRELKVEEARARLLGGELDEDQVFLATAERVLRQDLEPDGTTEF